MTAGEPPSGSDKRRHPRVELFATVEMRASEEMLILSVVNISLGGVFLTADGEDLAPIKIGSQCDLVVFDGNDDDRRVTVAARVVRKDANGIGLTWIGEDALFEIAELMEQTKP